MIAEMVEWAALSGRSFRVPGATMATYTLPSRGGVHKTLTSTTADRINPPAIREPVQLDVFNRSGVNGIYVRTDGQTAVAAADGTYYVPPGGAIGPWVKPGEYVSVVGNGDAYSVATVR